MDAHVLNPHLHRLNKPALHHDPEAAARALAEAEAAERAERKRIQRRRAILFASGRVLLGGIFVVSAIAKALGFEATRDAMAELRLSEPGLLLSVAIAVELVGGALLALGYKVRPAAVALIAYLGAVILLVHIDLSVELNRAFALADLAFASALLMLYAHGAGSVSLDTYLARRRAQA